VLLCRRIVARDLSELRAANVAAIRAARAAAIDSGVLKADPRGYDMITVPEVCAQGLLPAYHTHTHTHTHTHRGRPQHHPCASQGCHPHPGLTYTAAQSQGRGGLNCLLYHCRVHLPTKVAP
jgi:hypothetical protein